MIAYADRIIEKSLSMQEEKIRIIVVDDHSVVREFLQLILNANERFSVIKACDNGIDAIEQAALLQPDLMLLDINMSPLNGFEVAQKALEQNPSLKIIGFSGNNMPSYARKLMAIGAKGYITKSSPFEEIIHAIMEVHKGNEYIATEVRNMIL